MVFGTEPSLDENKNLLSEISFAMSYKVWTTFTLLACCLSKTKELLFSKDISAPAFFNIFIAYLKQSDGIFCIAA